MIIDMHTHIFPDKISAAVVEKLSRQAGIPAFTDGTLDALKKSMDDAQIDYSVILPVATNTGQVEKINSSAAALNEKFSVDGIISFGCIHPEFTNYREELSRVKGYQNSSRLSRYKSRRREIFANPRPRRRVGFNRRDARRA